MVVVGSLFPPFNNTKAPLPPPTHASYTSPTSIPPSRPFIRRRMGVQTREGVLYIRIEFACFRLDASNEHSHPLPLAAPRTPYSNTGPLNAQRERKCVKHPHSNRKSTNLNNIWPDRVALLFIPSRYKLSCRGLCRAVPPPSAYIQTPSHPLSLTYPPRPSLCTSRQSTPKVHQ